MASLNKVMLIGNLGRDPEIRYTPEGTAVANFSLATTEVWTDRSGTRQEKTEWHNIVAWNKLADIAKRFLVKGRPVFVEGRIRTREWDDKEGNKRRTTEIIASNLVLLGSRPQGAEAGAPGPGLSRPVSDSDSGSAGLPPDIGITDDDIPF